MPSQGTATDFSLTYLRTLLCISFAALLVKVTQRIWLAQAFFVLMICASLVVKTLVFPEPAPATIKLGPSVLNTASFCSLFKFSSNLFIESMVKK